MQFEYYKVNCFICTMIKRQLEAVAASLIKGFPVVVILGPRQVGKTTLVRLLAKQVKKEVHYLDLERPTHFDLLKREPETYLHSYIKDCVIIDEFQRMPELFPLLRYLVDENRKPARFIITGSASPLLMKDTSESLAGRVTYIYLHPIGLHELPATISMKKHWLKGGFPQVLTFRNEKLRYAWMDSFITSFIERDLPFLFDVRFSPITMRKLWMMLAHVHGNILNAEALGRSLEITGTTLKRYLDYLEGAFIITRLPTFFISISKRLIKAPKVFINDSGILHFLLRIHTEKELQNSPSLGNSWEGYAISQINYAKDNRLDMYYYRTQAGAECDLVLARGHIVKACVEIKYSASPNISKGYYQSVADLKSKTNFVITAGDTDFVNTQGIRIVGLKIFVEKYLPKLK